MAERSSTPKDGVADRSGAARIFCALFPVLVVLWVLVVLYPNPLMLTASLQRLANPRVDPVAVQTLADSMPSDPAAIEEAVLDTVPYSYDWEVYAMPWYFPTVHEVLENGRGDCKARAVVLASVFEAKGISYRINSSPMHVWVDYDGKAEDELENSEAGFYEVDPQTGARSLQIPKVSVTEVISTGWQGFWPPMPMERKVLLVSGLVILVAARVIWPRRRRPAKCDLSGRAVCQPLVGQTDEHQHPSQEESRLA
ncbi:MAG: transglutaminase domain-containing protein [Dehalococcoidia bacterium]|nr:transglutaminase domain-containing protein [Dehalococcoidia bacterium]